MKLHHLIDLAKETGTLDNESPGDSTKIVSLIQEYVTFESVLNWLKNMNEQTDETINHLATLMEIHPLGFEKYVIWDDDSGIRARLHYWPKNKWPFESIHEHRFHFCAKVVCGSYIHEEYDVIENSNSGIVELTKTRTSTIHAGDTYFFPAGSFHRVLPSEETTLSFLVRGPALLPYSRVIDPETKMLRKAFGAAAKFRNKLSLLSEDLRNEIQVMK